MLEALAVVFVDIKQKSLHDFWQLKSKWLSSLKPTQGTQRFEAFLKPWRERKEAEPLSPGMSLLLSTTFCTFYT